MRRSPQGSGIKEIHSVGNGGSLFAMFETEDFKNQLTSTVLREAANNKIERYETGIIDFLQRQASENESTLMEREVRKLATERRGVSHALSSAKQLTMEASKYAAAEKRTLLTLSDVEAAYRAKFCQFWPFCKQ